MQLLQLLSTLPAVNDGGPLQTGDGTRATLRIHVSPPALAPTKTQQGCTGTSHSPLREVSTAEGRDPRVHREPIIERFSRSPVPPWAIPVRRNSAKTNPRQSFRRRKAMKKGGGRGTSHSGVNVAGSSPICRAYADEASKKCAPGQENQAP
ncbi:hypothetical protein EDB81DRAFT_754244 [Dactylonectria macrodidyma]|uniref:Uncharacterized protein n=1 Tax=Dactylonectria macrodidyma TaxID=307937 RepID=A0A9P9FMV9_9HYPO|nr:hypothetical protein EDB81DRAFT_754244 [Dactylonectria macrodidyma]